MALDLPKMCFDHGDMPYNLSLERPENYAREIMKDLLSVSKDIHIPTSYDEDLKKLQAKMRWVDPAKVRIGNLKCFAAVLEMLVRNGKLLEWDMDFLLPTIQDVLPDTISTTIARLVCSTVNTRDMRVVSSKRAADDLQNSLVKQQRLNDSLI